MLERQPPRLAAGFPSEAHLRARRLPRKSSKVHSRPGHSRAVARRPVWSFSPAFLACVKAVIWVPAKEVPAAQVSLVGFGTHRLVAAPPGQRPFSDAQQSRALLRLAALHYFPHRGRSFPPQRFVSLPAWISCTVMCTSSRSADSALHDAINPEFERDIPDLPMHPPVLQGRSPRDNPQSRVFCQHCDQLVCHAVGKIVLVGVAGRSPAEARPRSRSASAVVESDSTRLQNRLPQQRSPRARPTTARDPSPVPGCRSGGMHLCSGAGCRVRGPIEHLRRIGHFPPFWRLAHCKCSHRRVARTMWGGFITSKSL